MIKLNSDFEIGVPKIDRQHQMLFTSLNRLEELLASGDVDRAEANCLLEFIEQYTKLHFLGEEGCMRSNRCPDCDKIKEEHADFLNMVKKARAEYQTATMPDEVLKLLRENMVWWFNYHLVKSEVHLRKRALTADQGRQICGPT